MDSVVSTKLSQDSSFIELLRRDSPFIEIDDDPVLSLCLVISTSTLLASVDSTEYHFISNLKDRQIKGITFVKNSAISTKYGTMDEVELCLKILSTNCLCSPSLSLIFSYIERPPRSALNIK